MRVTIETVALVLAAFAAAPSDGFVFNKNRAVLTSSRHDDAFLPQRSARPSSGGSNTQLNMMFDQLSSALTDVAKNFGGKQRMTENSIQPALKSVRRALLDADVNVDVATALIEGVKRRSL